MYGAVPHMMRRCQKCTARETHLASHYSEEDDKDVRVEEHFGTFESGQDDGHGSFPGRLTFPRPVERWSSDPSPKSHTSGHNEGWCATYTSTCIM